MGSLLSNCRPIYRSDIHMAHDMCMGHSDVIGVEMEVGGGEKESSVGVNETYPSFTGHSDVIWIEPRSK